MFKGYHDTQQFISYSFSFPVLLQWLKGFGWHATLGEKHTDVNLQIIIRQKWHKISFNSQPPDATGVKHELHKRMNKHHYRPRPTCEHRFTHTVTWFQRCADIHKKRGTVCVYPPANDSIFITFFFFLKKQRAERLSAICPTTKKKKQLRIKIPDAQKQKNIKIRFGTKLNSLRWFVKH